MKRGIKEPTIQTKKDFQLIKRAPSRLLDFACITIINKTITIFEALGNEDGSFWKEATDDEYNALLKNKTWFLTKFPKEKRS